MSFGGGASYTIGQISSDVHRFWLCMPWQRKSGSPQFGNKIWFSEHNCVKDGKNKSRGTNLGKISWDCLLIWSYMVQHQREVRKNLIGLISILWLHRQSVVQWFHYWLFQLQRTQKDMFSSAGSFSCDPTRPMRPDFSKLKIARRMRTEFLNRILIELRFACHQQQKYIVKFRPILKYWCVSFWCEIS